MPVITDIASDSRHSGLLEQDELFPIREVSRLTGVNPVTLRAWERRYGLIVPTRTASGHRLYSMADVERVRSILGWIESHLIPQDLVQADYSQWQQQIEAAVVSFDEVRLDQVYGQIFSTYSQPVVFQDILLPLWKQLLQRQDAFGRTSEWLFLDGFLRSRVLQRLLLIRDKQPRRVIVCALAGQCRELELLLAALFLGSGQTGVRVLTIGQPFDELTLVCERIKPQALVLFSNHVPTAELPRRLNRLAMSLDCPVLLAGDASDLAQESLAGSSIGCLGNEGTVMRQRLNQFLAGGLDT
ncbi:MerR family transcriptional regulator [Pseudomonas sp. Sample_22]|uniref:MerR family transcriptional regulator n=1 Tax=Pseudomonas sp. Sample_22 TaxID=2448266 RepID=UPI001032CB40|nr:MerR family transcriptional regulator [Pseudomonas sp. Sample_22]